MHVTKGPGSRNSDEIKLYDDADRFFRARARQYRRHIEHREKLIRGGEITAWEAKRMRNENEADEASAKYWDAKAESYEPRF